MVSTAIITTLVTMALSHHYHQDNIITKTLSSPQSLYYHGNHGQRNQHCHMIIMIAITMVTINLSTPQSLHYHSDNDERGHIVHMITTVAI